MWPSLTCEYGGTSAAQMLVGGRAPGAEPAARGRVDRARQLAADLVALAVLSRAVHVRDRHRVEEALGVVVRGVREHVVGGADLDELAEVHDPDRSAM